MVTWQAYEAAVSSRKAEAAAAATGSGGGGGGGNAAGLPAGLKLESEAALLQPGRKDGEMKVVREGGSGVVYSWNAARRVAPPCSCRHPRQCSCIWRRYVLLWHRAAVLSVLAAHAG